MPAYDVIVIGMGGVGSAAAFHLAQRGCRVLGLDRFPGGHDRGSSHGHTRVIRMAYFEHPDYVPLLRRAYQLWADLENACQQKLFERVGLLEVGPRHGVVVPGVLMSAQQHHLPIERLDQAELRARFPGFNLPDGFEAVFEKEAGYLLVEKCVLAHLAEAQRLGAELRVGESVVRWQVTDNQVTVTTDHNVYSARGLVVTAGAWAGKLLADLGIPLHVLRKHLHWYRTTTDVYQRAPTFLYETAEGYFYGFPQLDGRGVKVAEHSGGTAIADPLHDPRSIDPVDRRRVEQFLAHHMPGVSREPTDHTVCYYTMSPDEHFILDRHPQYANLCFAAGLSGHGFKFTTVLGEILADLALTGTTSHPIGFLSCRRPTLTG